jgi:hypothetical protein
MAVARTFFGLTDIALGPENQDDGEGQTDTEDQQDIAQNQSAGVTEALRAIQRVQGICQDQGCQETVHESLFLRSGPLVSSPVVPGNASSSSRFMR